MKFNKTFAISSLLLSLLITSCNGTGANSNTLSTNTPVLSLPNGDYLLPNGGVVSLGSNSLLVAPGKVTSTLLTVKGGTSQVNLGLKATVYTNKNGILTPNNLIKVSLRNPNVQTGSLIASTTMLDIDATQAVPSDNVIILSTNAQLSKSKLQNSTLLSQGSQELGSINLAVVAGNMIKASYLQLSASGSLSSIPVAGYASSNIIIFGFADITSSTVNPGYLSAMQTAINSEALGTINLLSIGGQYVDTNTVNMSTAASIVSTVSQEVANYNSKLVNGKISGIDLDLENGIDAATISALAKGFTDNGLIVSSAPQVITTNGLPVNSSNPTNLGLTSGGQNNQYGKAIAEGYIDYIMAQTYNTGGWTVDGYEENNINFFTSIATALNNSVKSNCTNTSNLCIPSTTQIVIGEVSNAGASGTVNNIFASNGSTPYNQSTILTSLATQMNNVISTQSNIDGVMQWSLNNDYLPSGWGDNFAAVGAFSSTIFGATPTPPTPPLPYFILQVTNSGPNVAGQYAYASATLVVNGGYWLFGNVWNQPITPQTPNNYQLWGTLPSSQNPATPGVADSKNLDQIFSGGSTSFTTSQIIINGYANNTTSLANPTGQFACPQGTNYVFQAGHSYNVQINPAYKSCAITQVN